MELLSSVIDSNSKVRYWLDISCYDLDTAQVMLEGKRFLYVGFMCHQAVEKTLKALYVFKKNNNPPYKHNLKRLALQCDIYELMSDEQKDFLDQLNPLNIEARYPTYKKKLMESLSSKFCENMIIQTKELQEWIIRMLLKLSSEK